LAQLLGGIGHDHPATGVDHRALGAEQGLDGALDLTGMALGGGLVGADAHLLGILVGDLVVGIGDIVGNVDDHGPGAPAGCHVEGLGDGLGDVLLTLDHVAVLHDGAGNTDHVGFLKGVVTDPVLGYLTGDHHQGDGIHVGGGNAGDGIGSTGR